MPGQLFYGGPIVTMTPKAGAARPESLLVQEGRIAFVGSLGDARAMAGRDVVDIALEGRALLPGFIDAHLHPLPMMFFAASADLDGAHTLAEVRDRLRRQATVLTTGEWLVAVQFETNRLAADERLDATMLDAWFPDLPVLIYTRDGHCVICNSQVLAAMAFDAGTADPPGGTIGRDAAGLPDGCFYEKAVGLPLAAKPGPSAERLLAAGERLFERMAQAGVTSIGAMLQSDDEGPGGAAARRETRAMPMLRHRIPQSIYAIVIGRSLDGIRSLAGSALDDPSAGTRARAIKIFADGTFGSCTACMTEPYADNSCTHGYLTLAPEDIYARMEAAHVAGYQICIHAIGDSGIATCVDLFERLLTAHPRDDHRHRIEHASIADRALIARIKAIDLCICTQPLFIRSERAWLPTRLGAARVAHAYPFRDFLDAGIVVAGSSDAPIEATDVIAALDFAVNRGGFYPEQGVTVAEALAMYTRNAAFLQFEEQEKGTLEVGKRADLVILDRDPLAIDPAAIGDLRVCATMIGGRMIDAGEQAA